MITKRVLVSAFILLLTAGAALDAQWARTYGGKADDWANDIIPAPGGGFVVAGGTKSYFKNSKYEKAFWIIKLSSYGTILWQKLDTQPYSSSSGSEALCVRQTKDAQIAALINYTYSGCRYFQILKIDKNGEEDSGFVQVYRTEYYPHDTSSYPSLCTIRDGGYIIAGHHTGYSNRTGGVVVHKINKEGWSRTMIKPDGPSADYGQAVGSTSDGGSVVAGVTRSFGPGDNDIWLLKLTSGCDITWQFTYGGPDHDLAFDILQTSDEGFIVLGQTASYGAGGWDIWILKLDKNGQPEWEKTYGGTKSDYAHSIRQTRDGGYIVAGTTLSFGSGNADAWVFKLDPEGAIVWEKCYGGKDYDAAWSVREMPSSLGGYIVAGKTRSYGAGGDDVLVMRLGADGTIDPSCGVFVGSSKAVVRSTHRPAQATQVQVSGEPVGAFLNRYKAGNNETTAQTVICTK